MLVGDFCDQNAVIRLAAVLQQHLEDLPDGSDNLIVFLGGLQDLLEQLEEADRVNKE